MKRLRLAFDTLYLGFASNGHVNMTPVQAGKRPGAWMEMFGGMFHCWKIFSRDLAKGYEAIEKTAGFIHRHRS